MTTIYASFTYFLLISVLTEARVISRTCIQRTDGSRCRPIDRPWQHDGVCQFKYGVYERCVAPDTRTIELFITARYRSLIIQSGPFVNDMYIRGTGPGLSWEKGIKMSKSATAIDVWTAKLSYMVDSDGLPCLISTHCSLNQQALEFRIYKDSFGKDGMKGPNFYIPLPISDSISGSASFRVPSVTVYPWFNGETVTSTSFQFLIPSEVASTIKPITANCTLLYPPSFNENIRKKYPLVVILGTSNHYKPLLEHLFLHEASVEEVAVLMVNPLDDDFHNMLPFPSSVELHCQGADWNCSSCQTCWAANRADPCEKEEFITKSKLCLYRKWLLGLGETFLELIERDLIAKTKVYMTNRLLYDPPRHRLTLMGHTDMGVTVFNEAIISPHIVGNVACFSPR